MKKILGVASAAIGVSSLILAFFAAPASAAEGWYANLSAGPNIYADSDINSASFGVVEVEHSLDTGPVVLGAIGKSFSANFRIEAELSYRMNDYDDISVSVPATVFGTALSAATALKGDTTTVALMVNFAYDFNKDQKLRPFVLAGLGGANVSINDATALSTLLADDSDTVFAYQVGVGFNYEFTDTVSAGISYRFLGTLEPDLAAVDGTNFEVDNFNHSVLGGVTFRF